jgi:hypothetical protein
VRQAFLDELQPLVGHMEKKERSLSRLPRLGQIIRGLQGVRRRVGEVDGDGVRLLFLGQLEEFRPARLGHHDVGAALGEPQNSPAALRGIVVKVKNAHGRGDYSNEWVIWRIGSSGDLVIG